MGDLATALDRLDRLAEQHTGSIYGWQTATGRLPGGLCFAELVHAGRSLVRREQGSTRLRAVVALIARLEREIARAAEDDAASDVSPEPAVAS